MGVASCCSSESTIYTVLDGCTDNSEGIVDEFINNHSIKVVKLKTPDVHEIKSINEALKHINEGYTICLQDDVILQEPDLEEKIISLYEQEGPNLGVVSFCRAANLKATPLLKQFRQSFLIPLVMQSDSVRAPQDPAPGGDKVNYYKLVYRMVAIKSPVCIPERVFKSIGLLDEQLSPYSYDDHEYCVRSLKAGFRNALYPLKFLSNLEWGGTRIDEKFSEDCQPIHIRNRRYIWQKHGAFIRKYVP